MTERSPKHKLTRHPRGSWYKSINGVWTMVAGKREAPDAASADRVYQKKMTELWAGKAKATGPAPDSTPLGDLFDLFIHDRRTKSEDGRLERRTLAEYTDACQQFLDLAGGRQQARYGDLGPGVFTDVANAWAKRYGPVRRSKYVAMIR